MGRRGFCTSGENRITFRIIPRGLPCYAAAFAGKMSGVVERGRTSDSRTGPVNLLLTIHKQPLITALRAENPH